MGKILILILALLSIKTYSQDDYQKWLEKENQKLNNYISEEDKKFVNFLKKEWIKAELQESRKLIVKPKPIAPVVFKVEKTDDAQNYNFTESDKTKASEKVKKELPPEGKKINYASDLKEANSTIKNFRFLGTELSFNYKNETGLRVSKPVSNKSVAEAWEILSKSDYKNILDQTNVISEKLKLNDWGYANLLYEFSKQLFADKNLRKIYTWFMLVKSGYFSRVAYKDDDIFVLVLTKEDIFSQPFFTIDNKKYYVIDFENRVNSKISSVHIYKDDFPGLTKSISLEIKQPPLIDSNTKTRKFVFQYLNTKYEYFLTFKEGIINYYFNYPQIDIDIYSKAEFSCDDNKVTLSKLKADIKDMSEGNALNFLLHFVQQVTEYKTDDEQFGFEKPLFPEESFYYSYSDCEDRSILFSFLVKNILKNKVILLDYPDHIATAVKIDGVSGDKINYLGKDYLICDPTYLGADIGMCMPNYKNVSASILGQ